MNTRKNIVPIGLAAAYRNVTENTRSFKTGISSAEWAELIKQARRLTSTLPAA